MSAPPDPPESRPDPSEPSASSVLAEFQKAIEEWSQAGGKGNVEQEEAIGMKLLTLAAQHAAANPSPDDEWRERIAAAEHSFEWERAIALRREHIAWKRSNGSLATGWKDLTDLSRLLWMCGQRTEAAAVADEAVVCAKASDLSVAPPMTVPVAARYAAALGRLDDAERMIEEAMAGAEATEDQSGGMTGRLTLSLRLCRAHWALERGDLLLAQRQLDDIWPEIQRYADSPLLAGLRCHHAEHARLSGRLHLARGESTMAVEAFVRAIHHWQAVLHMPQIEENHFIHYAMAKTRLRMAEALARTQPTAANDLRKQANEQFDSLRVPPAPPD